MTVVPLAKPEQEEISFSDFWCLWPKERRVCKKDAELEWRKIPPEKYPEILIALVEWRKVWYARGEWEYVVHPHRWLKKERWEDELPGVQHASHMTAKPPEAGQRTAMPQYVKDALANLRKR